MLTSCSFDEKDKSKSQLPSKKYDYLDIDFDTLNYWEQVYVPIYSDIYHGMGDRRLLLTATLSIRNTDKYHPIYINNVEYLDSDGDFHREYLKSPIRIDPLHSKEFVIEDEENKGGAGAKFILKWGYTDTVNNPVIQAVMISTASTQGISFVTESVVIDQNNNRK